MIQREVNFFVVALSIAALFFILSSALTLATSTGTNSTANLTIYDQTDTEGGSLTKFSLSNLTFFANFTSNAGAYIDWTQGTGMCTVRYNLTGDYTSGVNMTFNSLLLVWQHNRTFTSKGAHRFTVNCTSTFGDVAVTDIFNVTNTPPRINVKSGSYIDLDGNAETSDSLLCFEDSLCTYNFSTNLTDTDANDVLTYNYTLTSNTTLANFTFNTTTSILQINVTTNLTAGSKEIELNVRDSGDGAGNGIGSDSGVLRVSITPVNDPPIFLNLQNQTFNASTQFNYSIFATDEENNTPFILNISFLNCSVMQWSTRDCTTTDGRALFNSTYYTFDSLTGTINITFTPTRNDVGNYTINFTLGDSGTNAPVQANVSQIVTFSVANVNAVPYYRYLCANAQNATEDSQFDFCTINVSDLDETNNLTLSANETWFLLNGSALNNFTLAVNETTSYNASFLVNFTPGDLAVGNWSINFTLLDTGSPALRNSTLMNFFVANVNDSDFLGHLENLTAYTTNNYTIYVNASDNDLLIPDKRVFNESITFYSNWSCVNVVPFGVVSGTNVSQARIHINATDTACFTGSRNYSVIITANDSGNFSTYSRLFIIQTIGNNAPEWNASTQKNISLTEDSLILLNFTQNVTDTQNDPLNFTYFNATSFFSFSLNILGFLNFTPVDDDVGLHYVTINVSDGPSVVPLTFNFTVLNVNDAPFIETPLTVTNATIISGNSNISAQEDNRTTISLFVRDSDLRIPAGQKGYYNESLNLSVTLSGPNTTLLSFTRDTSFPTTVESDSANANKTRFSATFTPGKNDVGNYSVLLTVTDATSSSTTLRFNLTIASLNHLPVFNVTNQTSLQNSTFFYDMNATDLDDGADSTRNLTYSYVFLSNTTAAFPIALNVSGAFNTSLGIFNLTLNHTHVGVYRLNVTVRDTSGSNTSADFTLSIYGTPLIVLLAAGTNVTRAENSSTNLTFQVNHTVGDTLSYFLSINNETRYVVNSTGDGTNFTWNFTLNYTDETHGLYSNLTLLVLNPTYATLNATRVWNMNITHVNAPVALLSDIPNRSAYLGESITYTLSSYFSDADASDSAYGQDINYTLNRGNSSTGITYTLSGATLTFTRTTAAASETFNVTANETYSQVFSNLFSVNFSAAPAGTSTATSSGGGGGGSGTSGKTATPVSLKLLLPDPFSMARKDKIIIPITLQNTGTTLLKGISLSSLLVKNGKVPKDVRSSFDIDQIESLASGEEQKVKLTIETDTSDTGLYEITINASVESPVFSDWGKIFMTVKEGASIDERILFTEEFVVGNPECAEIKEVVDEARLALSQGDIRGAEVKVEAALNSCKKAISQRPSTFEEKNKQFLNSLLNYASLATAAAFIFGLVYYSYRRIQLRSSPAMPPMGM